MMKYKGFYWSFFAPMMKKSITTRYSKELAEKFIKKGKNEYRKLLAHADELGPCNTMAMNCGVDILIHIPIGEVFPDTLAQKITEKKLAVIPTLVMMKVFANSPLYGYKKADYEDAEKGVALLRSYGVSILVGTDANSSGFGIDNAGRISVGEKANMVFVKNSLDKDINHKGIIQIWVDGKSLLKD